MKWPFARHSLRFKLVFASVLVEVVLLTVLVSNSVRLIENSLVDLAKLRLSEVEQLLNTALAGPLAERDYATLEETLHDSRRNEGIQYLVLLDVSGQVVASSGWERNLPLPDIENDIGTDANGSPLRFDSVVPITIGDTGLGVLRYGLSTQFLAAAKRNLLRESAFIAGSEILLSIAILTFIGLWLTRHLAELTRATTTLAEVPGDAIMLPVKTRDEVGQLTETFNRMAAAINARIDALSQNEEKFHAIADYTYDWESWYDADGRLIWLNPSVERMTGYSIQECMEMPEFPLSLAVDEDRARAKREFQTAVRGSTGAGIFRFRRKDGEIIWGAAAWQPIYNRQGNHLGTRASIRDVTEQAKAEQALQQKVDELQQSEDMQRRLLTLSKQEQARMKSLLAAMKMGILFETADNCIAYCNPAFLHIWMIDESVILTGKPTHEVLTYSANVLARPDNFSKYILQVPGTHELSESFEVIMADGRIVTQLCYPVRDPDGRFIGRLWVYEDVTRERQTAEQLIYLAERDSLTGLYNRRRFQQELGRVLDDAARRDSCGALLFFDLDEFKFINDTFGHRAGDAILIRVASEVNKLVRRNEVLSRLGGDEFAVLMPDATPQASEALAERITRAIAQIPFNFEGQNLRLTTSVGIAHYPHHATEQEDLIIHADAAMYQAKEAGKNAWRVYRQELDTTRETVNRLTWNERIIRALENNLLCLHFQGVYNTQTGRLSHIEALVRMVDENDPGHIIMPGYFIPFAEKSGKVLDIDRWVIRESVALLARSPDYPAIAINISGRSFDDPALSQYISHQLQAHDVRPGRLMVELTETAAVSDLHDAQRFIESLQRTGCNVCLDDFGSGFSSFTYLKHLKADFLKIDGQFIRDLPNDYDNQIFVRAIVDVARGLRKRTVAEFVEDKETLDMLRQFGVEMAQGYYLNMPGPHPPAAVWSER